MIDFSKTEEQELLIESIKELLEREMPAEKAVSYTHLTLPTNSRV